MQTLKLKGRNEWRVNGGFFIVLKDIQKLFSKYSSNIFQNDGERPKLNMVAQALFASHHNYYCLINQSLISCCDFRNIC